jgi:hypothetical protein
MRASGDDLHRPVLELVRHFLPLFGVNTRSRAYRPWGFRRTVQLGRRVLEAIQKRALAQGLPYQTLISSLLHKYAAGRLKEV